MREIHRELEERYRELKESRNGPVYLIEHGLCNTKIECLFEDVKRELIHYPIESGWWNENYLPLLVAATEVGYDYRGTGTDFWPIVEDRLGVTVEINARHRIRQHFQEASRIHKGAHPPDTPWARAFSIIVWPITHALLPIEFHRPLALMLKSLDEDVSKLNDDELHRAIKAAAHPCPVRFSTVIEDAALIVAVTRRLLGEDSRELSSEVVDRIKSDIESDDVTKLAISGARQTQQILQRTSPLPPPQKPLKSITGSLYLHHRNGKINLQAVFPPIQSKLLSRLQQALRRRRFAARLWGVSTPVPSMQFLSSLPFTLNLSEIPPEGEKLLPDLDLMDINPEFRDILASFRLDVKSPLLFAISSDGTHGRQIRGTVISGYRKYWLLTKSGELPHACVDMGEVGPFRCYQIDPKEQPIQKLLRYLGIQVRYGISVGFAGSPPLEREAFIPAFAIGDQRIVVPRHAPSHGLKVQLGEEIVHLNDENVVTIDVPEGEHELSVSNGNVMRDYCFRGMPSGRAVLPSICSIEPRSVDLTVQALLRGELYFDIHSLAPIDGLDVIAEIEASGHKISVTAPLEPLPCSITSKQEPLVTLLDGETRDLLAKAKSPTLRLRVGHLCSYYLELEQRIRPCWWEYEDGEYVLTSELGSLPFGWISATAPATKPVPNSERLAEEVGLLAPMNPDLLDHGETAQFATLCIAPPHIRFESPDLKKPLLSRYRHSEPGVSGFEDIVESYLRWSLAETFNFIAELRRRQIARELDSWVTAICCGERWIQCETSMNIIDPWEELCRVIEETGFGRDQYIPISSEENINMEVSRIAVRQIREKMPDLWARVGPTGNLAQEDYDMLDLACGRAYTILGEKYRKQGKRDIAEQIEEGDPGEAPEMWDRELERIQSVAELHPLVEMLIPSDMAEGLRTLEPSILTFYELAEELEVWVTGAKLSLAGNVPSAEILKAILALWVEPEIAVSLDWRRALNIILIERSVARAARYLALRSRRVAGLGSYQ